MANKMRTTTHHGRSNKNGVYRSRHNDRNYNLDNANNVDTSRSIDNSYYNYYENPNMTFDEVEQKFYEENFSKQLEGINNNYIKQRHGERCKRMEDWRKIKRFAPEEEIRQIGDMNNHVNGTKLAEIDKKYTEKMEKWNNTHNNPFTVLDRALHVDETSPHIHERKVWSYIDDNGCKCVGQEKALEQAGVELFVPSKKEGRYNNRKMTFDKMARDMWIATCRECGIELETEPIQDAKHNRNINELIRDTNKKLKQENEELNNKISQQNSDLQEAQKLTLQQLDDYMEADKDVKQKKQELEELEPQWQEQKKKELEEEKRRLQKEVEKQEEVRQQELLEKQKEYTIATHSIKTNENLSKEEKDRIVDLAENNFVGKRELLHKEETINSLKAENKQLKIDSDAKDTIINKKDKIINNLKNVINSLTGWVKPHLPQQLQYAINDWFGESTEKTEEDVNNAIDEYNQAVDNAEDNTEIEGEEEE